MTKSLLRFFEPFACAVFCKCDAFLRLTVLVAGHPDKHKKRVGFNSLFCWRRERDIRSAILCTGCLSLPTAKAPCDGNISRLSLCGSLLAAKVRFAKRNKLQRAKPSLAVAPRPLLMRVRLSLSLRQAKNRGSSPRFRQYRDIRSAILCTGCLSLPTAKATAIASDLRVAAPYQR